MKTQNKENFKNRLSLHPIQSRITMRWDYSYKKTKKNGTISINKYSLNNVKIKSFNGDEISSVEKAHLHDMIIKEAKIQKQLLYTEEDLKRAYDTGASDGMGVNEINDQRYNGNLNELRSKFINFMVENIKKLR